MIVWRLTRHLGLDGVGGTLASGRWHTRGTPILYTARSPAGALIEVLAGLDVDAGEVPEGYRLLKIELSDDLTFARTPALPDGWRDSKAVTRAVGDAWLAHGSAPLLLVPSVIIEATGNVLIAPTRIASGDLTLLGSSPFTFDPRLLHAS